MKIRLLATVFFFLPAFALGQPQSSNVSCNPPETSQWNWDLPKLVKGTKNIVVAKLIESEQTGEAQTVGRPDFKFIAQGTPKVDSSGLQKKAADSSLNQKFTILEVLSGDLKAGEPLSLISYKQHDKSVFNVRCFQNLTFKKGKKYILFLDSYNPNGYRETKDKDQFYNEIKGLLEKK